MAADVFAAFWAVWLAIVLVSECRGQCQRGNRPQVLNVEYYNVTKFISSPGYPGYYDNNLNCSWQIVVKVPEGVVHLHVQNLWLDSNYANCRSDYVDLYDGNYFSQHPTRGQPLLAHLCSLEYGLDFYSTTPYMYVHFVTDASETGRGFSLRYAAVPRSLVPSPTTTVPYATTVRARETEGEPNIVGKIIGIFIGSSAGLVLVIVILILVGRRYCRPYLLGEEPGRGSAASAPPPEDTPHGSDRTSPRDQLPFTALLNDADAQGVRQGDPRTDGPAGRRSPGPGGHLGIPEQNGGLGTPRAGNSPRGSPRPGSRLDVPERDYRGGSPNRGRRGGSPRREGSPGRDGRDVSPWRDGRDVSPWRDGRDVSPWRDGRDVSPRRDGRDVSPWRNGRDVSPRRDGRDVSPRRDRSPRQSPRPHSPRPGEGPRSPGGHTQPGFEPPPIRPPDTSMDAPPSYSEAMAAFPEPSAPPPE